MAPDSSLWNRRLEGTLRVYDEPLLRQVAEKLLRPRGQWPVAELIERCQAAYENIATIDRRLKELQPAERRLLALMGHSSQPLWQIVHLVEMATVLGDDDGLQSVHNLLHAGLLFPELPETCKRLRSFNHWLTQSGERGPAVFSHPSVLARAIGEDLGLPVCSRASGQTGSVHEADGLEWPLRLSVVWQLAQAEPLRRTQQGEFFKRDQDRLRNDPLLNHQPADHLVELPDSAFWTAELASVLGILKEAESEWRAGESPATWHQGLLPMLACLWTVLPHTSFSIGISTQEEAKSGNPMPSAILLSLLYLSGLDENGWAKLEDVERWISKHHPYWTTQLSKSERRKQHLNLMSDLESHPVSIFLLTIVYQLRMVQVSKAENGKWVIRLSPVGRWLLGIGPMPFLPAVPSQTLLVQPNLEIVAYRQGLTPGLIERLSCFASWKSLGAACLLQVQPETVYRALESGLTLSNIQQTLEQSSTRSVPPAVLEMLRTWTAKRDRLCIYPSGTLFEFAQPEDLNDALTRGLPATRLSERLAVVASENAVDFRHFRLSGTRDYALPPEKCVDIDSDGVTLTIDPERSDLLVETELRRFAEFLNQPGNNGKRQYRITSASLTAGQDGGLGIHSLEEWFQQRTGRSLSPAVRLLLTAPYQPAAELKQQLVLHVASSEVADGLLQLPETRTLIQHRLGPKSLAIAPEHVEELCRLTKQLGLAIQVPAGGNSD
jgi:hypothetical protein